jgi:hypothetical protein
MSDLRDAAQRVNEGNRFIQDFKLRIAPWFFMALGLFLLVSAFGEKKVAVTFGDVYPGISAFAAGLLLRAFLKYVDRSAAAPDSNAEAGPPGDDAAERTPKGKPHSTRGNHAN